MLTFDELLNFRDFGGGTLVSGRLFRSAAHDRLSGEDLSRLASLGIGVVIDLRKASERAEAPSRRHGLFDVAVVESPDHGGTLAPHESFLVGDELTYPLLAERMAAWYADAPFLPEHQQLFRRGLEAVAAADTPILVHCAAGKDRTGLFVMLLQHILGVSEDVQLAEYLLTNQDARLADHINARLIAAAAGLGKSLPAAVANGLSGVTEQAFRTGRAAIAERHGSLDGYLDAIGVTPAIRAQLRNKYVLQRDT